MKNVLKAATVLTWFNLIIWGLFIVFMALGALAQQSTLWLILIVLLSAIPLNCYAALQLQKSIRHPAIRLNSQTPTGIRFVGFVALFLAISCTINAFTLIGNAPEALKIFNEQMGQMQVKEAGIPHVTAGLFRVLGLIGLILGICVGVNVILNFRLLRWYYLVNQSDARDQTGDGA